MGFNCWGWQQAQCWNNVIFVVQWYHIKGTPIISTCLLHPQSCYPSLHHTHTRTTHTHHTHTQTHREPANAPCQPSPASPPPSPCQPLIHRPGSCLPLLAQQSGGAGTMPCRRTPRGMQADPPPPGCCVWCLACCTYNVRTHARGAGTLCCPDEEQGEWHQSKSLAWL